MVASGADASRMDGGVEETMTRRAANKNPGDAVLAGERGDDVPILGVAASVGDSAASTRVATKGGMMSQPWPPP